MNARIALTLRTVAGLSTAEIARAFLVTESTMTKRLVRARAKIKAAGIPYRVPPAHLLPERATGVFAVLYLLFNEGYSASAGETLVREPLTREAIRLTRLVVALLGDDQLATEALGLLALMLFHQARTASRTDASGDIITLEHQDRALWDPVLIAEGTAAMHEATSRRSKPGPYLLQAAIAQCHVVAPSAEATDFGRVARLYEALGVVSPSPVVELNRAVAVAMSRGPEAGLTIIDGLVESGALDGYYLLPAARADLLRRLGRRTEAAVEYRAALALAPSDVEQRYLSRRLEEST
jgi:RNA polymerase sigma-70 factor (ECF subfamily)